MSKQRWRLVVSDLGTDAPVGEATVEADNWMEAVSRGRAEIGEEAAVPRGATCRVAPGGDVTLIDPVAQRRYRVSRATETSFTPRTAGGGPKVPADVPPPAAERAHPKKPRVKQTVAFDAGLKLPSPADLGRAPGAKKPSPATAAKDRAAATVPTKHGETPAARTVAFDATSLRREVASGATPKEAQAPQSPSPAPAARKRRVKATVAFEAPPASPAQAAPAAPAAPSQPTEPPREEAGSAAPVAAPPPDAGGKARPSAAPGKRGERQRAPEPIAGWRLLSRRDRDPDPDNPLRYRERLYVVPPGQDEQAVERFLRRRFEEVRAEIAEAPPGKFVNLAVFDHAWSERPERPPLLILQWKDWRGDPVLQKPLVAPNDAAASRSAAEQASRSPAPAPATAGAPPAAAEARKRATTSEQENRLATAFEACQDLLFLQTPAEGMEFVVRLLAELVPAAAHAAALYDINDDVLRVVAATGAGEDGRRGRSIPAQRGLFGAAVAMPGAVLRFDDLGAEPRFEPELEGVEGLRARTALYAALERQGALLGALQILERQGQDHFDEDDEAVVRYVAEQAARFLAQARIRASRRSTH